MKKQKFYELENVAVSDISSEGKGILKLEGKVIFIDNAVTGDVVNIRSKKSHKNYDNADITKIITPSEYRVEPYCAHYENCGGCKTQHIDYAYQLQWKQRVVKDALERIGKLENIPLVPIIGCKNINLYRNKLDYAASNKRWLTNEEIKTLPEGADRSGIGFHKAGMFDKVLDIDHCYHMVEPANRFKNEIRSKSIELGIPFFDIRNHAGILRNILIRRTTTNEWMLCLSFREYNEDTEALMAHLKQTFPEITSLLYNINNKKNDAIYDLDIKLYAGRDHIIEELGGKKFKIGAKSFFQTNSEQSKVLYDEIKKIAQVKEGDILYDLYTGVGSIGIYLSDHAKKIVGIELVEDAIKDAKINAEMNELKNCHFFSADMKDLFNGDFRAKHGQPDIIVLDPPRAGMHPDVVQQVIATRCPRIVYVSCNPQTLAFDLVELSKHYTIDLVQPVDMFPQTIHIETIVKLSLK